MCTKIRTTGETGSIRGDIIRLTASAVRGIGAVTTILGITPEHGHSSHIGDILHGTMTHGTTQDGIMTLGITDTQVSGE